MKILRLCCVLAALTVVTTDYQRTVHYHDQIVVKCELTESFNVRLEGLLNEDFIDPWGLDKEGRLHVRLGRQLWTELQSTLPECSLVIDNLEDHVLAAEIQTLGKSSNLRADLEMWCIDTKGPGEAGWFEQYHPYEETVEWYRSLAQNYSNIVSFVDSIGKSFEGRDIPAVHFTGSETPRFTVYLQCQIHAREWISGSVCMYIANYLCESYETDDKVRRLLNELEFVLVPIVNPDGYEYTWTDDRLWRKNRRVNSGSGCVGVDLNRNFNNHWNEGGSSSDPCSPVYHGQTSASELETQAIQNYFAAQNRVVAAIDWHSFGQLILRPYGWTVDPCPDDKRLKEIGDEMRSRIFAVNSTSFTSQMVADLYTASGGATDWFYGEEATRTNDGYRVASYAIELRDIGLCGFLVPPTQIIPSAKGVIPAVLYLAETMLANPIVNQ